MRRFAPSKNVVLLVILFQSLSRKLIGIDFIKRHCMIWKLNDFNEFVIDLLISAIFLIFRNIIKLKIKKSLTPLAQWSGKTCSSISLIPPTIINVIATSTTTLDILGIVPLYIPVIPSFFQVLQKQSSALVYLCASSPYTLVLITSTGWLTITEIPPATAPAIALWKWVGMLVVLRWRII